MRRPVRVPRRASPSRSTTRSTTPRSSATSWCATSRARRTPPTATPAPPARWASAPPPAAPAPPTWSPASPRPTWTRPRWSPSPGRCAATSSARTPSRRRTSPASRCRSSSTRTWSRARPSCPRIVHEAFHIASTGRPGPVVIDIPVDIALGELAYHDADTLDLPGYKPTFKGHIKQIRAAAKAINEAQRPVLYLGGGAITSDAAPEILKLAELRRLPVATTLMALGAFPETHELSMGMLGMHGTVTANYAVHECDLLINLGARFDDRVTGKLKAFAPHAKVIHADVDPAEIGKNVAPLIPIVGDARHVAAGLVKELEGMEWSPEQHRRVAGAHRRAQGRVPAALRGPQGRQARAAAGGPGDRPHHRARRHHLHRRRPAPDVGDAVLHVHVPAPVRQLRRPRHHGLRPAGAPSAPRSAGRTRRSSTSAATAASR